MQPKKKPNVHNFDRDDIKLRDCLKRRGLLSSTGSPTVRQFQLSRLARLEARLIDQETQERLDDLDL